jgi:threonyl-tRNA synthetase
LINQALNTTRRTALHLLGLALQELFPKTLLLNGEVTPLGFYFDVMPHRNDELIPEVVEEKLREIILKNLEITKIEMLGKAAIEFFLYHQKKQEAESLQGFEDHLIELIRVDTYTALCPGSILTSSKEVAAFQIESVDALDQGAYRISGTAFPSQKELKKHQRLKKKFKTRDHRVLGSALDLFHFDEQEELYWLPKGNSIRSTLLKWWEEELSSFETVSTPNFTREDEYKTKAHSYLYQIKERNTEDLPFRLKECSIFFEERDRQELWGLFQNLELLYDRGHSFCLEEQLHIEILNILEKIKKVLDILHLDYEWVLRGKSSTPQNKYFKDVLVQAMQEKQISFSSISDGTSPLSLQLYFEDGLGRQWPGSFVSLSLNSELQKSTHSKQQKNIYILSFSLFGSFDRLLALLLEQHSGQLPIWLAPEQVRIITVEEKITPYAKEILERIQAIGLRVNVVEGKNSLSAKIRLSQCEKVPYTIVLGAKEKKTNTLTVRPFKQKESSGVVLENFLDTLKEVVCTKTFNVEL